MAKIELPQISWLVCRHEGCFVTNTYSGSLGTLPNGGCVSAHTFQYRVYVDISSGSERNFRLIAESFLLQPWHLGSHKTDFERLELECSESGVRQAEEWLSKTASMHGF